MSNFKTLVQQHIMESTQEISDLLDAPEDLDVEGVKKLMKHPDFEKVNGLRQLSYATRSLDPQVKGHVIMHAMAQPSEHRNALAHIILNNGHGTLDDTNLRTIANKTLKGSNDVHLAGKIVDASTDKNNLKQHVEKLAPGLLDD